MEQSSLSKAIHEFLMTQGVIKSGIATLDSLAGGPPSVDLSYILPEAQSAISYALPLDRNTIRDFLSKKDQLSYERHSEIVDKQVNTIGKNLQQWLEERGITAKMVESNNVYRSEGIDQWQLKMYPDLSHRYIAVASGVGSFGHSGNIGIKGYGTAIFLGSVVTDAMLEPTPPIPNEQSFCTKCKICVNSCTGSMFELDKLVSVSMGGHTFQYSKRKNILRCQFVCSGLTGLHKSGKWSTWSPGRYDLSDDPSKLYKVFNRALGNYSAWPERPDGIQGVVNATAQGFHIRATCGNCGIICWGDQKETNENYRLLTSSGCVIQNEAGELLVLPSDEAQRQFENFPRKHQKKYKILPKKKKPE